MNYDAAQNTLGLDGSRVIDRMIYLDPAVYAAEQERIFARTWQWIAHESELPKPGDYVTATIAGRPIVACRDPEGRINAFLNTCTHRGAVLAPLSRGSSPGGLVCFYHGWCFAPDGRLTAAPLSDAYGEGLAKGCYDAPPVRLETFAGSVFVNLDAGADSLTEFLGDAGPYIERFTGKAEVLGRVRWRLPGNWKLFSENYRDNYHPMFAHPIVGANYQGVTIEGMNAALSGRHGILAWPSQGNPQFIKQVIRRITGTPLGDELQTVHRPPSASGEHTFHILGIFPNLGFQHLAGGRLENVLEVIRPTGLDSAMVETVAFGEVGEDADVRQARLDRAFDTQTTSGKISGDDVEAARRCSLGFGARAVRWSNMDRGQAPGAQGAKNDEYTLRAFHAAYRQYMAGEDAG